MHFYVEITHVLIRIVYSYTSYKNITHLLTAKEPKCLCQALDTFGTKLNYTFQNKHYVN